MFAACLPGLLTAWSIRSTHPLLCRCHKYHLSNRGIANPYPNQSCLLYNTYMIIQTVLILADWLVDRHMATATKIELAPSRQSILAFAGQSGLAICIDTIAFGSLPWDLRDRGWSCLTRCTQDQLLFFQWPQKQLKHRISAIWRCHKKQATMT